MDLSTFTTDKLLASLPPDGEDDRWELKRADILNNKTALKKELGKQVSAFANSGGGYLVIGIDEKDLQNPQPCEQYVGRQPMRDYLSALTEQSVEYPIRHFKVHRIPFADDGEKSIFVVEIEDSPAAPHQAKEEKTYYYRIDGHSKPAPHFHLELLRNRFTKSILKIEDVDFRLLQYDRDSERWLEIELAIKLKNVSSQCATNWGVLITTQDLRWKYGHDRKWRHRLTEGACATGDVSAILPSQEAHASIRLLGESRYFITSLWQEVSFSLRPVSQNHVGDEFKFEWPDEFEQSQAVAKLDNQMIAVDRKGPNPMR